MRLIVDARPLTEPLRGGVGRVAFSLVDAFAAADPGTEIVCATTGSTLPALPGPLASRANVRHVHLKLPNKIWSSASFGGLVSLCEAAEKRAGKADAFFMPNLGFVGRLPTGIPTALLLHDLSFLIEPRWFRPKQRLWHRAVRAEKLIRGATRLLAVSETTKRDAVRLLNIPEGKIDVIPLGSTLSPTGDQLTTHDSRLTTNRLPTRYCLALGLGDPRKNAATAIEAVRLLRMEKGFEDVEIVIVGAHAMRPGRAAHAPTWVHIIGCPSDAELADLYRYAAAFLYPSWYEGFGLPLHEAAAHGTPCIASTAGALPETAPAGTIFANPAKPHHWTAALGLALARPGPEPPKVAGTWQTAAGILRSRLG